ncbi:MAG: hydantoinase/oxoprolinase family protein, partial [Planctomycetaceae bacterium]
MPDADLIALDIGGANLKAADGRGWTLAEPFALWREWRGLPAALGRILEAAPCRRVVATMTGEIADCYASRAAGVSHIVESLVAAAHAAEVRVYLVDGRLVSPGEAVAAPLLAAASNWHALARLAGAHAPASRSVLIDVGSTTTDIVPLVDGAPAALERDDAGRMRTGELVYTGIERTPLAALVRALPHRGVPRPVASERYADSRDAWLLVGGLPEDPADRDTADGAPATREAARVRLARTMLVEPDAFPPADAVAAAERCADVQARRVAAALRRVAAAAGWQPDGIVLSGHGEPLARRALSRSWPDAPAVALGPLLGPAVARAAPAHARARIARGLLG